MVYNFKLNFDTIVWKYIHFLVHATFECVANVEDIVTKIYWLTEYLSKNIKSHLSILVLWLECSKNCFDFTQKCCLAILNF